IRLPPPCSGPIEIVPRGRPGPRSATPAARRAGRAAQNLLLVVTRGHSEARRRDEISAPRSPATGEIVRRRVSRHSPPSMSSEPGARPFVFLDRDGTLVRDVGYPHRLADYELLPGAIDALSQLRDAGYGLAIVTNQSGIGRGIFTREDYD